jgi:hypothetical protein
LADCILYSITRMAIASQLSRTCEVTTTLVTFPAAPRHRNGRARGGAGFQEVPGDRTGLPS